MNILEISPYNFPRGGSDKYFLEISLLLEKEGHNVYKLCTEHESNQQEDTNVSYSKGINTNGLSPVDALKIFYNPTSSHTLKQLLSKVKIDVAHVHIYYGQFSTSILHVLKKHGIPIVQTIHDYKPICPIYSLNRHGNYCTKCSNGKFHNCIWHKCNRGSLVRSTLSSLESYTSVALGANRYINTFVAVCQFQADLLINSGINKNKISVLYNFSQSPKTSGISNTSNKDTFLYFGRIEESKGLLNLVNSFLALNAKNEAKYKLVIAGEGSYKKPLLLYLAGVAAKNIDIIGHVDSTKIEEISRSCIASILVPNAIENCSMAVLESLALGLPVIAGTIGALPELITNNENGLLVEPNNESQLTNAMQKIAADENLQNNMQTHALKRANTQFNEIKHVNSLIDIFSKNVYSQS